ncbi:MAG TPA: acylphosphatase [Ilumatobacteraceae bacterium]|nr:acylphosphatase [Ilumatobacteraceae bacterium]
MSEVRCRAIVSGRVQGVFFRDSCRAQAQRLGLRGWVRNRPDGTVEVVAEGPRDDVEQLLTWCRQGPSRAQVTGIAVTDEVVAAERGFRIKY